MGWLGWIIIAFIVIWFIGKFESSSNQKTSKKANTPERDISKEAQEIADKITTIQQLRTLERRTEAAGDRLSEHYASERAYENACHKHDILETAVEIANSKIYKWQFTPEADLDTPLQVLNHAYKVYSLDEYPEIKNQLKGFESDWYGIDGYNEKEESDPYLKPLIKFRSIVESNEPEEVQIKKINQLVSKNKSIYSDFFDSESHLSPGDQWFLEKLHQAGLPLADVLYSEGYTTPKKCLEIDAKSFSSRKGVGPKKLEQLKHFQASVRNNHNNA